MQEKELILLCQSGDRQAFRRLFTQYSPFVFSFLLKQTGDPLLSEDLTQETFLRVICSIRRFRHSKGAAFSTYLLAIAKNLVRDEQRRLKRLSDLSLCEALPSAQDVEQDALSSVEHEELLRLIDALPWEQSHAIRLKYLEQLSLCEIAELSGCRPQTVKSRIHNGIVRLRKQLEKTP